MICLNFFFAIAAYLFLFILLLFWSWIFYNSNRYGDFPRLNVKFFQQCPICSHLFFNDEAKGVLTCPRCDSLIKEGEGGRLR